MPTTKRTEEQDEVFAEQWMNQQGYDLKPPRAEDPYQIRRIMRQCFANGLTVGRLDGIKHPHFTVADLQKVADSLWGANDYTCGAHERGHVNTILTLVFPEATFDE